MKNRSNAGLFSPAFNDFEFQVVAGLFKWVLGTAIWYLLFFYELHYLKEYKVVRNTHSFQKYCIKEIAGNSLRTSNSSFD